MFLKKKKSSQKPTFKGALTAIFATTAAVFLLLLAGLSLTGTAIAMIATMPLFIVFSPILVPAGIATTLLATGLAASGGAGATALAIIMWLFKRVTGVDPEKIPGVNKLAKPAAKKAEGGKPGAKPKAAPGV